MIRDTAAAVRPSRLSTCDVSINVVRKRSRLEIEPAEIVILPSPAPEESACQVRWHVEEPLLADELILVFGRSLDWTGPTSKHLRGLKLVENVFPRPFVLTRQQPVVASGPQPVVFPPGIDTMGWSFGAVLVRGDDPPWVCSSILRIVRGRA